MVVGINRARQASAERLRRSPNGRLRDRCLNEHVFRGLARRIIEAWRIDYNARRPILASAGSHLASLQSGSARTTTRTIIKYRFHRSARHNASASNASGSEARAG